MLKSERRRERSAFVGPALELWLSAIAQRNELAKVVLADAQGLLVAASHRGADANALAARAPLAVQREDETTVDHFEIEDERVYLCVVGEGERCTSAISEARAGIKRIMETRP